MRMILPITVAAAALFAVSPALAQNETGAAGTAVTDNAAAPTDANSVAAADNTAVPVTTTETTTTATETSTPPPAPEEEKSFPWGILGLLGLIGLLPRFRRS
ncbi:MAG TPA: WGxxGxxG family protein [Sphingomicrobium sp.]|jgi:hypothetical protein|nr:WGxxGxxG family protein [Sphingomicrobium sp.]